jgi:hypothetical protein
MNTEERTDSSSYSEGSPPQADPVAETSPGATARNRPRSILGRLAGHWKGILLTWLLVSAPVAYAIYRIEVPTYEAFSLLQVEPMRELLFAIERQNPMDLQGFEPYLQTQVQLITSDRVLDSALGADPRIAQLPMIRESEDPTGDLRRKLKVEVVDKHSYLIRVALATGDPQQSAMIVNAVVDAYMAEHTEYHRSANKALTKSLNDELDRLGKEIMQKKADLKKLAENSYLGLITVNRVAANKDNLQLPSLDAVSEEQFGRAADRLIQADLELIDAQARLETARRARKAGEARLGDQPAIARDATADEKLRELEATVDEVKRRRIGYLQYLENLKVRREKPNDALSMSMMNQELTSLLRMQDLVTQKLEQLNFEAKQDVYRITQHDRAGVPKVPTNGHRPRDMAAASVGVLFLILGAFLTRELTATRIAAREVTPEPEE